MTSTTPADQASAQAAAQEREQTQEQTRPVGWSFLRSWRWVGYASMLLIFSIACVLLGNWQFDRRAEARAEIDRLDANYGSPATPLADELPELDSFTEDTQKWRTVSVTGEYVGDPFLARNRPGPEGVGSDLLHALETTDGRIFFVDRGWLPVDGGAVDRGDVGVADLPAPPSGTVQVEARLRASEPSIAGRTSDGITVASIELPELARLSDTEGETYTGAYGMLVTESPATEHGVLPAEPERDEGPHLSYALQWYVFILIAAIGVAIAARSEYRTRNAESQVVQDQDRRAEARRTRRGPTDSDIEDALLDA